MNVEGYISKRVIRYWLENYTSLAAGDRPYDEVPGNSGPKEIDGVTMSQLNKVMLDKAIDDLPEEIKLCCKARWVFQLSRREALKSTGLTRRQYDYYCKKSIDLIYNNLNGTMVGVKNLLNKIGT